jgi:hypothetical protein
MPDSNETTGNFATFINRNIRGRMNWMDSNSSIDHVQDFRKTVVLAELELLFLLQSQHNTGSL